MLTASYSYNTLISCAKKRRADIPCMGDGGRTTPHETVDLVKDPRPYPPDGGPSLVVTEGSLRFHVGVLRKALGDGQTGARYVTNVPGRGYCFVALILQSDSIGPPVEQSYPADTTHNLPRQLMRLSDRSSARCQRARIAVSDFLLNRPTLPPVSSVFSDGSGSCWSSIVANM